MFSKVFWSGRANFTIALGTVFLLTLQVIGTGSVLAQNDESAVVVNGESVSQEEIDRKVQKQLDQFSQQMNGMKSKRAEMMKQKIRDRVVQQTIDQLVLETKARERGIEVSRDEVEEEFKKVTDQFPSDTAFERLLDKRNTSRKELRSNIRKELTQQKMLSGEFDTPEVTEEEIRDFYEQNKEQLSDSSFDEVKGQLRERLRSKKRNQQLRRLVTKLKEESEIQNNLTGGEQARQLPQTQGQSPSGGSR